MMLQGTILLSLWVGELGVVHFENHIKKRKGPLTSLLKIRGDFNGSIHAENPEILKP